MGHRQTLQTKPDAAGLMFYIPVNSFSFMSGRFLPSWTESVQSIKYEFCSSCGTTSLPNAFVPGPAICFYTRCGSIRTSCDETFAPDTVCRAKVHNNPTLITAYFQFSNFIPQHSDVKRTIENGNFGQTWETKFR